MSDTTALASEATNTVEQAAGLFEKMLAGEAGTQPDSENEQQDQPEGGEQDAESPDSEESDEQQEQDEPPADPDAQPVTVKVDGKEQTLTLGDLKRGYLREADYTRKTQELANNRRAVESELTAAQAERAQYGQALQQLQTLLQQQTQQEPDWDKLQQEDPLTAARLFVQRQQQKEALQAIQAEQADLTERNSQEQAKALRERIASEETKLLEAIPEWKDTQKRAAAVREIADYASSLGYTPEDLSAVTDHRILRILKDAVAYQKVQKASKDLQARRPQQNGPRSATPGGTGKVTDSRRAAMERLKQTGDPRDAARIFEMRL